MIVFFFNCNCPTYGHWEYDGAIVLGRDAVQGLEVAQLEKKLINSDLYKYGDIYMI